MYVSCFFSKLNSLFVWSFLLPSAIISKSLASWQKHLPTLTLPPTPRLGSVPSLTPQCKLASFSQILLLILLPFLSSVILWEKKMFSATIFPHHPSPLRLSQISSLIHISSSFLFLYNQYIFCSLFQSLKYSQKLTKK